MKAFHIVFVVAWFAGLFYLPRLFVYHAEATGAGAGSDALQRFCTMERRLLGITHVGAALTLLFGAWLLWLVPAWASQGWLHAKLLLVLLLLAYHGWCVQLARGFARGANRRSARWYRVFNEVPALLLVGIVVLVVVKPF